MLHRSRQEWLEFVRTGTRTGKLAITRATGGPHVTPSWFDIDETPTGDDLVFTTGALTVQAAETGPNPHVSLRHQRIPNRAYPNPIAAAQNQSRAAPTR